MCTVVYLGRDGWHGAIENVDRKRVWVYKKCADGDRVRKVNECVGGDTSSRDKQSGVRRGEGGKEG